MRRSNKVAVAVYGAGPGIVDNRLCTVARCGMIFVVDHHPYRLHFAADRYGAIPINFDEDSDPAQSIIEQTGRSPGRGMVQ